MLHALLVDDEELSVRMLESIVDWGRCGIGIAAAAYNGEEALRLFTQLRPEIVITDIRMPGMDGLALMRRIKEFAPETEFILVSAYADFEYAKEVIMLGGASYLLKPVDEFELEKALKKISEKIGAQQAAQRMLKNTQRQKDMLDLCGYMRTGAGKSGAHKSAVRMGVGWNRYALMGFILNETSMNAYIENSVQLDTQLPYLQARLEERLSHWCDCLLFDFFDISWCAIIFDPKEPLADCANAMAAFFESELHMEIHVCFTQTATGLEALPTTYRALSQLNKYSFFLGEDSVLGYGYNCENSEFSQVALMDAQRSLEAAIRQNDGIRAGQVLRDALENLHTGDPSVLGFVYDFCYAGVQAVKGNMPTDADSDWQEMLRNTNFQTIQSHTTLDELLAFMERVFSNLGGDGNLGQGYSRLVNDGIAYLQENYDRNISLEEICDALGVSRNYFCYLFKRETEQNLWACLTDIRLAHAKELLRTTQDKTYAIAYRVGYDNPSYFSKIFKKNTGMTPNEYRNSSEYGNESE